MWAFVDGRYVEEKGDVIKLENRGLTFGDGLFEVIRTYGGSLFFFEDHFGRMVRSAEFFGLNMRYDVEYIKARAFELIEMNGIVDGEIYLELTRGTDPHREHRYPPKEVSTTFFMLALPIRKIEKTNWTEGVNIFSFPDLRHQLCVHKTIDLLPNVLAKNFAYERGGYEALMYREDDHGKYVTEGGSSNYFMVKGGKVFTPAIDNILPGITRGKVINLLEDSGVAVVERRVYLEEFLEADETFLVSTVSRVMPIKSVDDLKFELPGEITEMIKDRYERFFFSSGKKL